MHLCVNIASAAKCSYTGVSNLRQAARLLLEENSIALCITGILLQCNTIDFISMTYKLALTHIPIENVVSVQLQLYDLN